MRESKSVGATSDNQNYFYKEAINSRGRSDDPNDFYKALDATFTSRSFVGVFARAWNSIRGINTRGKEISEGMAGDQIKDSESHPNQSKNNIFDEKSRKGKGDDNETK